MPTQTFWNLPEEKRDGLIALASEEFAENPYESASLSRIVARAGIAKGSLYQYFADKRELFLFLIDLSTQKRLAYVQSELPPEPDMSFWQVLRWQVEASTRAALAYPLLTRVFLRAMHDNLPFEDEMLGEMRRLALGEWSRLVQAGIDKGDIEPSIAPELAAMMLNAVFKDLGRYILQRLNLNTTMAHELDVTVFQTPEVQRIFDDAIHILEHGLRRRNE